MTDGPVEPGEGDTAPLDEPHSEAPPLDESPDESAGDPFVYVAPNSGDERGGRRRGRVLVGAALVVVIVGAAVGVAVALTGTSGGSASPSAAVTQLLTAANNSDVLGALAVVDPGERNAIEPGLEQLVANLRRLHVLSSSASLSHVAGVTLDYTGVKTSTTYLTNDLAEVKVVSGTARESADPAALPLGSFVTGLAASELQKAKRSSQTSKLTSGPEGIVTVNVNGGWYVSIGYSIAVDELAAKKEHAAPPSSPVTATGSSTSTGAVHSLLGAIAGLNVQGIIADTPPDEMAALQAYAPLFLSKLAPGASRAQQSVHLSLSYLSTTTETLSVGTLVKVNGLGLTGSLNGAAVSLVYARGCLTGHLATRSFHECGASKSSPQSEALIPAALRPVLTHIADSRPDLGFVTVQVNGNWYVSPTRTLLQGLNAYLSVLRPGDLLAIAASLPTIEHEITQREKALLGQGSSLL